MKIRLYYLFFVFNVANLWASQPTPMVVDSHGQQADLSVLNQSGTPEGWERLSRELTDITNKIRSLAPKDIGPATKSVERNREKLAQHAYDARHNTIEKKRHLKADSDLKAEKEHSENVPTFSLRPYEAKYHYKATQALFDEAFGIYPDCKGTCTVILDHTKVIGFISYSVESKIAKINWLIINKNYRCKGLGSTILMQLIEYLRTLGLEKILAVPDNENAEKFYKKNKFIQCKEEPLHYEYQL